MRSVRVTSPGRLELVDAPPAPLRAGEARVAVAAVGLCGSDVHLFRGEHPFVQFPVTPGHEFSGTVVETGPGSSWNRGARVAVHPLASCGECGECRAGRINYCRHLRLVGVQIPGACAEQVVVPERCLYPLPPSLDFAEGALVEPLAIALHLLERGGFRAGQSLAIIGCGTIGTLSLQVARARGAGSILAVDRLDERVELARRFGADVAINNRQVDVLKAAAELEPDGFHIVVELVCEEQTLDTAVHLARRGGVVVLVALPVLNPRLNYVEVYRKELTLRGTRLCTDEFGTALGLTASGSVRGKPLITHYLPLAEAARAFDLAANHPECAVKVMLVN